MFDLVSDPFKMWHILYLDHILFKYNLTSRNSNFASNQYWFIL